METVRVVRLSLRWRVAIAFGLGSLLITGVLAIVTWDLASGYMLRQRELGATAQAQVNVRLVDGSLRLGSDGLSDLLKGLATDSDTSVLLRRSGGWLTSGRQIDPAAVPPKLVALAVANLLENAERYGGGAVRVAVVRQLGHARIEVDDSGPSIPAELREQVFQRFSRGGLAGQRGTDGGSGLGLALVAQHVERHSGRARVEDRPGGGARFVVEVPAVES